MCMVCRIKMYAWLNLWATNIHTHWWSLNIHCYNIMHVRMYIYNYVFVIALCCTLMCTYHYLGKACQGVIISEWPHHNWHRSAAWCVHGHSYIGNYYTSTCATPWWLRPNQGLYIYKCTMVYDLAWHTHCVYMPMHDMVWLLHSDWSVTKHVTTMWFVLSACLYCMSNMRVLNVHCTVFCMSMCVSTISLCVLGLCFVNHLNGVIRLLLRGHSLVGLQISMVSALSY